MKTAAQWKTFYAREREALGDAGLDRLFDGAPELAPARALVFPHTRLAVTGPQVAAVARAVVRAGHDRVLALGVLHGARAQDAELVRRAREGDAEARSMLRRVHGPGGHTSEEFSLDAFGVLLERAARLEGRSAPTLLARFPFLTGDDPGSLPGVDELVRLREEGCALVATTDPIHHGAGYGTEERRDERDPATRAWAEAEVRAQLDAVVRGEHERFLAQAARDRSDFRDVGPVLSFLLGPGTSSFAIEDLALVDYAEVLDAPRPTWVAGALVRVDGLDGPMG